MTEIIQLMGGNRGESLLDFVERRRLVTLDEVCRRFGWDGKEGRRQLDDLERAGHLTRSVGPYAVEGNGGNVSVWASAKEPSPTTPAPPSPLSPAPGPKKLGP